MVSFELEKEDPIWYPELFLSYVKACRVSLKPSKVRFGFNVVIHVHRIFVLIRSQYIVPYYLYIKHRHHSKV